MSETAIATLEEPSITATVIQDKPPVNLSLSAETPEALAHSQKSLIDWCVGKLERERALVAEAEDDVRAEKKEVARLKEFVTEAIKGKWRSKPMIELQSTAEARVKRAEKRVVKAQGRVEFYEKFKVALEAGYYVVPNFPVNLIAIRTDVERPRRKSSTTTYAVSSRQQVFKEYAKELPAGQGSYQNPVLGTCSYPGNKDGNVQYYNNWSTGWDEMEFPVTMARLEILQAAKRAMALKIFDEVGALPTENLRCGDPVLVGRLCLDGRRRVTFMIAWHLDTRTLP